MIDNVSVDRRRAYLIHNKQDRQPGGREPVQGPGRPQVCVLCVSYFSVTHLQPTALELFYAIEPLYRSPEVPTPFTNHQIFPLFVNFV